jgi:hypothetical protein
MRPKENAAFSQKLSGQIESARAQDSRRISNLAMYWEMVLQTASDSFMARRHDEVDGGKFCAAQAVSVYLAWRLTA